MTTRLSLCWSASAPADAPAPAADFAVRVVSLLRHLVIAWTRWRNGGPRTVLQGGRPAHPLMVESARSTMGSFHL